MSQRDRSRDAGSALPKGVRITEQRPHGDPVVDTVQKEQAAHADAAPTSTMGAREQKAEGRRQKAEGSRGESVAAVSIQNRVPHPEGTRRSKIQNPEPPNPQSPSAWPRPLQQRLQQQEPPAGPSRVRSQPLAVHPAPTPMPGLEATSEERPANGPWRWTPVVAGCAALVWLAALGLLFSGPAPLEGRVASPRLTFLVTWGLAALITFLPTEFRLGLPGLTWQGVTGWVLLGYTLAFVPPPTGWLLDLPDLPVYLVFFLALFYAVAAAALPLMFLLGLRMYTQRIHRLDVRRARRQAYELGLLAVALMVLASLRLLAPLTGLLLIAVFVLVEILLLSQVTPDG